MEEITVDKLYELYLDTLQKISLDLLSAEDDIIEYNIFEEFDIGVHSFFHENSLRKLFDAGYINEDKMSKSILLRNIVIELQNTGEWNVESFKKSEKWKRLLHLSDEIKSL